MSWSITTRNLACIASLAQAKQFWDKEPVWKNRHPSWRPLDGLRMDHKRLVKNDWGYQCVLYDIPMVTYFMDGSIALRCHSSNSSKQFASHMEPTGTRVVNHKGTMYWRVNTGKNEYGYYTEGPEPLRFEPTGEYVTWRLVSKPAEIFEWSLDRSKVAAIRKKVKPFRTWYDVTLRLGGFGIGVFSPYRAAVSIIQKIELLDDVANYAELACFVGDPRGMYDDLYKHFGAKVKVPVPPSRLPRSYA